MKKDLVLVLSIFLISCHHNSKNNLIESVLKWEDISDKIIERSDLLKGERVLMIAEPGRFDTLVSLLAQKIKDKNALYLGTIPVGSNKFPLVWQKDFSKKTKGMTIDELTNYFSNIDLGIMLPGATPQDKEYSAMQNVLKKNIGRTIHFHWSGAYDLDGKQLLIDDSKSKFYQKALLQTNYSNLYNTQMKFEKAIRNKKVRVLTSEGTDIEFRIGNRPVTMQDGNASSKREQKITLIDREIELPAGAVRVAPLEETVNGKIVFPISLWGDTKVENLILTVNRGKITKIEASYGEKAVREELNAAGEAGYSFREFALGLNPLLSIPKNNPWIPYYGYGAGVVRLSLGDNSELGGKVKGDYVRWNFFPKATVIIGLETWVLEGDLIKM